MSDQPTPAPEQTNEERRRAMQIPAPSAIAIFLAVAALALGIGAMRWSALLLEEQLRLRNDFMELSTQQAQVNTQYEFWLDRVIQEREDLERAMGERP
jgi:hypothetical protein